MEKIFLNKFLVLGGVILSVSLAFSSCESMENQPLEIGSDDYTWDKDDYTGQYAYEWLNAIYTYVPGALDRYNSQPLDVFSGDAVPTDANSDAWPFIRSGYSVGNMFQLDYSKGNNDVFGDSWDKLYAAIRRCNIFLKNYRVIPWSDKQEETYYGNECRALRAYFYMILLRDYGGIPLIGDAVYSVSSPELKQLKRASYADCVRYISDEFDAVQDSLRPYPDLADRQIPVNKTGYGVEASGQDQDFDKIRKWAVIGLKARLYLYAASPLYNGTGKSNQPWLGYPIANSSLWKIAADDCRVIINTGQFKLEPNRAQMEYEFVNGEFLWCKNYHATNQRYSWNWTTYQLPMGFKLLSIGCSGGGLNANSIGNGKTSPTQELVDTFPMSNGKPIDDASSGYDAKHPYKNRDPRLSETIFYNGSRFLKRTIETYIGGLDNTTVDPSKEAYRTKTGYYTKRFIQESPDSTQLIVPGIDHHNGLGPWCPIRYADILLMYAEAQTEWLHSQGASVITDETVYEAIDEVRQRAFHNSGYQMDRNLTYDKLINIIRDERHCEFAFEESRFWDIRRWKIAPEVYANGVHGVEITKNADGAFSYAYKKVSDTYWNDRMYYYPIDRSETLYNDNIKQNPGY